MIDQLSLFQTPSDALSLDELFRRSIDLRTPEKFIRLLKFIKKFRNFSIYNNTLVYLQNPNTTYYATAPHWYKNFGRCVKEDAKPLLILAPMTPILFVYDLEDTYGNEFPSLLINPPETDGTLDPSIYDKTVENCKRDRIFIKRKKISSFNNTPALKYRLSAELKSTHNIKAAITINEDFNINDAYTTLCRELAHIYMGHFGNDKDEWWPDRRDLNANQVDLETESICYIVCGRAGLKTNDEAYIRSLIDNNEDLQGISIELISKTAALIERMGKQKLPPRKERLKEIL
jgi:hypothetical protein